MYEKIVIVFQTIFENQDVKGMSQKQESMNKKLQLTEKKCISQEAIIKDLERKLSIYQSKTNAMESYKTNLENDKDELQKQLAFKESQIKYLSNELMNTSVKQSKSNHEELIEIIENIKSKAQTDKSALKKALKFQKAQIKENEEKFQKQLQETNEKERMMFDIAAQRDQLKIQLTVLNNNIVQQKSQIEELKIQNMKLQNEIAEKDLSCKKETNEIQNTLDEKLTLLDKALKTKKNLEETVEELETELEKCKKQMKNLKEEMEITKPKDFPKQSDPEMLEEIHRLTSLLQSTKEAFENFKLPSNSLSGGGDQTVNDLQASSIQTEILEAVKETKEHLLELKNLYKALSQVEKGNQNSAKNNNLEKQVKKLEHLYEASVKENQALKAEIEEMKNTSASTVQKTENYFTANMPSDNFTRKLQLELMKKSDEILKMTYDFQQKEKYLENQLREFKDKARTLEFDRMKLSNLEEELKTNKLELSVLQQKKEEETERLLQRTKELQDSLDLKSAEFESLQRYVQLLKSSYFNVFGGS